MDNLKDWHKKGDIIKVNGLDVFYKREGRGETLICIHGFPSSSLDFYAIWPALITQFDVVACDLIGLGKSTKPDSSISVALQADILEKFCHDQGITNAHILAHDLGDTVAQELLARHREKIAKVQWKSCILMNGGIFPEAHRPLLIQKLLRSAIGSFIAHFISERSFRKSMIKIFSRQYPPSEEFLKETWQLIITNNGRAMIPKLIQYMKERVTFKERWEAPLRDKVVPMLLINGVLDPISGSQMVEKYNEIVPNPNIISLENAGHYPHVEVPNKVLEAIFEFHDQLKA